MDPMHCKSLLLGTLLAGAVVATAGCGQDSPSQAAGGSIDRATAAAAAAQSDAPLLIANVGPDTEITAQVRLALFAQSDLKSQQIFVDTADGVVTLSGAVDSTDQRDRAKQVARRVAGVKQVIDLIAVKAGSATG